MSRCLDKQTLMALARGELATQESSDAETHLIQCRRCAEALAKLPIDDDLIERLRDLEHSRNQIGSALAGLRELETRITTTIFGRQSG